MTCSFDKCNGRVLAKGLCVGHYTQQRAGKELSPLYSSRRMNGEPPRIRYEEVECTVVGVEGPCHAFIGGKDSNGYGMTTVGNKRMRVHQYVWVTNFGEVPSGLEIDHVCINKSCCNIKHLRTVTHQVNCTENVRGHPWQLNLAKTHCPKGHEYSPENTEFSKKGHRRNCRICRRVSAVEYRKREKLKKGVTS